MLEEVVEELMVQQLLDQQEAATGVLVEGVVEAMVHSVVAMLYRLLEVEVEVVDILIIIQKAMQVVQVLLLLDTEVLREH